MTKLNETGIKSTDIRKQAEELSKGKITNLKKLSSDDAQSLVHELEVHQIELKMQNEELRRAQKELEDARNRYSDLYDFAPIGYFVFDKNGLILEVNLTGAKKLGRERANLIKKPFSLYFICICGRFLMLKHRRPANCGLWIIREIFSMPNWKACLCMIAMVI